jgi:type I restriction enzyme S subunit
VLLVARSGILSTIPVGINNVPVSLNQDMKALSLDETRVRPRFILRWVQGLNRSLLGIWAKEGATVESLEHEYVANTRLPLPDLKEQDAILATLDLETARIDALISKNKVSPCSKNAAPPLSPPLSPARLICEENNKCNQQHIRKNTSSNTSSTGW